MTVNIIVFEGDGIGPEIMRSTLEIIDLLNTKMEIDIKSKTQIQSLLKEYKKKDLPREFLKRSTTTVVYVCSMYIRPYT